MDQNYKMVISYDGTRYQGWEHQPGTDMTIQGKLENVISRMLMLPEDIAPPRIIAAGRTDAGVHARAMVANVVMNTDMSEDEIRGYLNLYLPEDISVDDVKIASERFHARYNAVSKTYVYTCYVGSSRPVFDRKYVTVLNRYPSPDRMRKAAEYLTGTHDFRSFCGNPRIKKSTVRNIDSIQIRQNGPYIRFTYHGNGFLRNQVRIMTGTLLEVGYGNIPADYVAEILEARDRAKAGPTAPPMGLCLMKVDY